MYQGHIPLLLVALATHLHSSSADILLNGRSPQQSASLTVTPTSTSATSAATTTSPTNSSNDSEINQLIDITIDGKIFPPPISFDGISIPQDFSVNCVNCSITGNLSVSAGGGVGPAMITPPATFETAGSATDFDFSDFWVGVVIDSMAAHFDIAINLTASNDTNELIVPLYTFSKTVRYAIITVTATFTPELHGWVNTTSDVNFTHGFDFEMQPGAGLLIPIEHLFETKTYKFNESTLTPLPYTSSSGDTDMSLELSFRPKFDFAITATAALDGDMTAYIDVPKLDVQVSQVQNVTSSCDAVASAASVPKDQIFGNLTNVVPSIGFDASVIFSAQEVFEHQSSRPFAADFYAKNLSTACLAYDPAKKTLGPAAQAKASGSKIGAAFRVRSSSCGLALVVAVMGVVLFG